LEVENTFLHCAVIRKLKVPVGQREHRRFLHHKMLQTSFQHHLKDQR